MTADVAALLEQPTMTVEQAAHVYGISRSTAYECVRLGTIPSIRLSQRRVVVPTAAVKAALGITS